MGTNEGIKDKEGWLEGTLELEEAVAAVPPRRPMICRQRVENFITCVGYWMCSSKVRFNELVLDL